MVEDKIIDFCSNKNNIYVYGTGLYAKTVQLFLEMEGIAIAGFITSTGMDTLDKYPVFSIKNINLYPKDGVILAVNEKYCSEILRTVKIVCEYLQLADLEYALLEQSYIFNRLKIFNENVAKKKECINKDWDRVLIVQCEKTFGDMVWSTAFIRELRRNIPNTKIDIIINNNHKELFKECSYVDTVFGYECNDLDNPVDEKVLIKAKEYYNNRIKIKYDAVFLPRLLPSGLADAWENVILALESGAKIRYAHSYYVSDRDCSMVDSVERYFTNISRHLFGQSEVKSKLDLITDNAGIVLDEKMELWPSGADKEYANKIIEPNGIKVAVGLVGSNPNRCWPPCRYTEVIERINDKYKDIDIKFVLMGGNDAVDAAKEISESIGVNLINLVNKTSLSRAISVMNNCDIYLGSDTGLMHVAAAFKKYVIELSAASEETPNYWGSSPERTGPWKTRFRILKAQKPLPGCGCYCSMPVPHCINQITVDDVVAALENALLEKLYERSTRPL